MKQQNEVLAQGAQFDRREALAQMTGLTFGFALSASGVGSALAEVAGEVQTAWVTIRTDGTVSIMSPAAEMGQGSRTSLALIIAEELDADWARVRVEMSPLDDKMYGNPRYGIMYTAGSASIPSYYKPLRMNAAQARRVLIDNVAEKWGVPAAELTTEPNMVLHKASGRRISYGEIAAFARMPAALPVMAEADLKSPANFRYLGHDVLRVDVPSKKERTAPKNKQK
jgi:isoquinoline 1-oxidoreductase beta subunit